MFAAACCARRVNGTDVIPPEIEIADDDADGAESEKTTAKRASSLLENSTVRFMSATESAHGGSDIGSVQVDIQHNASSFGLRRVNMNSPKGINDVARQNPHESKLAASSIELATPNPLFDRRSHASLAHPESLRPAPMLNAALMQPPIPSSAPPALAFYSDEFVDFAAPAPAELAAIVSSAQSKAPSPRDFLFASRKTRLQVQSRPSRQFSM